MRKTVLCLALTLLAGGLTASPALATFSAIVELPAGTAYSPYGGPATVRFVFGSPDPATIFTIQLREPGHGVLKQRDVIVDPASDPSPHVVPFAWKNLSVSTPTDYVVNVRRQDGGSMISSARFTVLPKLVSGLSAKPSPFYPLVHDGYKDRTRIGFSLSADTEDTDVRIFADDVYGRCCGPEIRTVSLGPLAEGTHRWSWDGTRGDASAAPKGTYYVKIGASDATTSVVSKAQKVVITKGWVRRTATKEKKGSAYARAGDMQATERGGNCNVWRTASDRQGHVLCANAEISVYWAWGLQPGERIEKVSFVIDGGHYGCRRTLGHTTTQSFLRVTSPPTSSCDVASARIRYSYPVRA